MTALVSETTLDLELVVARALYRALASASPPAFVGSEDDNSELLEPTTLDGKFSLRLVSRALLTQLGRAGILP